MAISGNENASTTTMPPARAYEGPKTSGTIHGAKAAQTIAASHAVPAVRLKNRRMQTAYSSGPAARARTKPGEKETASINGSVCKISTTRAEAA